MIKATRFIDLAFDIGFSVGYEAGKTTKKKDNLERQEYMNYLYDLKDKLKILQIESEKIREEKQELQEKKEKERQEIIKQRQKEVEIKIKLGKKLTTEDLVTLQGD